MLRHGQLDSEESCIVVQSGPTHSLSAKFPHRLVVTCSKQTSCCRRTLRAWPWKGVCEPLMPDVVAPKAHQNNCSYLNSVNLPPDLLCKNLAWWAVTWRTSKKHKTVKIRGERGGGGGGSACPEQYSNFIPLFSYSILLLFCIF